MTQNSTPESGVHCINSYDFCPFNMECHTSIVLIYKQNAWYYDSDKAEDSNK